MTVGKSADSCERPTLWVCCVSSSVHISTMKLRTTYKDNTPMVIREGREDEGPIRTDSQMTKGTDNMDKSLAKVVCSCGKICKNVRGLKIHQGRMKCR